jgi:hypothetical protein
MAWGEEKRRAGATSAAVAASAAPTAAPAADSEVWEVSNRPCIGLTEVQLAQLVLDSAALLMNVGHRIGAGETLHAAMTPPPPPGSASMQLAQAVHRRRLHARLHLLTLSSTPLPVLDWEGRATRLSLAGLHIYGRDVVQLSELLALNTVLGLLMTSDCPSHQVLGLLMTSDCLPQHGARLSDDLS